MSDATPKKKALPELPHKIELRYPIAVKKNGKDSAPIEAVTIKRRPTYGDVEKVEGLRATAAGKRMVALITDCHEEAFAKMDLEDARRVLDEVTPFFQADEDEESESPDGGAGSL